MADEYVELVEFDDDFNEFDDADVSDYVGYGEQEEDLSEDDAIAAQMDASDETSSPFLEPDFPEVTEADDGEAVEIAESDGDDEDEFDVIGDEGVTEFGAMSEDEDLSEDDAIAAQMDASEEDVIELDYDSPENPDTIECDCICAVKTGDRVMVQLVNGEPTVIGVVGWGDALQSDVDAAKGSAKEAHDAAVAAQEDADAAKKSAEAAESAASSAITQASVAESAASNALSQAGIASTSAANAGRAAALAQAALNTMGDYDWDSEDFNQDASLFYKDELGAHIVDARGADGTYRTDINSEGMEVTEVATGDKVASLGAAGAIIGKDKSTHTTITDNMFSVTGSNGYPTFQAENGTVITGNPYSDHVAIDSQTLAFYKQDGSLVSYPVRSTYDNSVYAAVINSDAYAESDRAIKFQLTATVSLNYYSSMDVLKEFNKLVVVIDGAPVRISATIPAPYVWKNNTGTVIGNWTVTWTFETSSMSEISISGANQDGPLIGFGKYKVVKPYVSMSAEFYEQNARRTFAVYADGSMETSFLDVNGSIKATNSISIDGNVSFDPVDGLGTVDDSVEPFDAFIADKDGIRVSNGNGVAFNADSDGNVTAEGNVSAGANYIASYAADSDTGKNTGFIANRDGMMADGSERSIGYMVGSGGKNAGIWDFNLGKWLIYSNGTTDTTYLHGANATVNSAGYIGAAGGYKVNGNPLLKVEKVTDSARSVGASTATSWNVTLPTIDGYKPIGVVGFNNEGTSSTSMIPIRHRISGQSLYFAVRNASSTATSNLVYDYYILYAANGVL